MILSSILKALGQIGDPRFRGVLLKGLGITLAALVVVYLLVLWTVGLFVGDEVTLPVFGAVTWVDDAVGWASLALMLVMSAFLMVPVASAVTSAFLEDVAEAVEDRHYPGLPPASPVGIVEGLRDSLGFLGLLVGANLFAVILYLVFLPFAPLIFWGLNGFLLGREYFTVAAMRRVGRSEARRLWRRNLMTVWAAGVLMAIPLTIPVMNLVIPILGAATFTHIFHGLRARVAA